MPLFTPDEPQQIMLDHLRSVLDSLNFVGMGVGKTATCLQHVNDLLLSGESVAALIVAPLRVVNLTILPKKPLTMEDF